MPPAPSGDWISYGPSFVPAVRAMRARNYSLLYIASECDDSGCVVGELKLSRNELGVREADFWLVRLSVGSTSRSLVTRNHDWAASGSSSLAIRDRWENSGDRRIDCVSEWLKDAGKRSP